MSPVSIYIIVSSIFVLVIGYDIFNWLRGREFTAPEIRIQRLREKLSVTVVMLGFTFLFASILFHVNILQYHSPIGYKDVSSITLQDFKGYKLPNQTLDGGGEFAFITTSIDWHSHNQAVEVESLFHPSRSYVHNENLVDQYLLQHELYHFHITELFARKIREQLSMSDQIPNVEDIENIIAANKDLASQIQFQYDDETYHGYILKKQRSWQLKIDSLLSSLHKFDQTIIQYH